MTGINDNIKKLANINEDACNFYAKATEKAEDAELRKTFQGLELMHKNVVNNLQSYIRATGEDTSVDETVVGNMYEFWGQLMASISNDVDLTLVKNLEEAEDRCLHFVEDIISDENTPQEAKLALQNEYDALKKSHDFMRDLKENMKDAA